MRFPVLFFHESKMGGLHDLTKDNSYDCVDQRCNDCRTDDSRWSDTAILLAIGNDIDWDQLQ